MTRHINKIRELISNGQRQFYATELYPVFEEVDAITLFQNDLNALQKLHDLGEIEIVHTNKDSRKGTRLINFVNIKVVNE